MPTWPPLYGRMPQQSLAPMDPEEGLDPRELAVLHELGRGASAQVSFQGLRRSLQVHQQSLSRVLRRLVRSGLVAKGSSGYRLTDQGSAIVRLRQSSRGTPEVVTVVEALLPPDVGPEEVSALLAQRWFQGLRWYGMTTGPLETTLSWQGEPDRSVVRLRVNGHRVVLEAEASPQDHENSFRAVRSLLVALAELYGVPSGLGRDDDDLGPMVPQPGLAG